MASSVFVISTTEKAADLLISHLVENGYTVGPLSKDSCKLPGELSCLVALSVARSGGELDTVEATKKLLQDVKGFFSKNNYTHHGIIVNNPLTVTTWFGSNIELPKPPTKTAYDHLTEDGTVSPESPSPDTTTP